MMELMMAPVCSCAPLGHMHPPETQLRAVASSPNDGFISMHEGTGLTFLIAYLYLFLSVHTFRLWILNLVLNHHAT